MEQEQSKVMDDFLKQLPLIEEEFKENSEKWTNLISIDPGMLNLGWIFACYKADVENKTINLEIDKKRMKSEYVMEFDGLAIEEIEHELKSWIYKNFKKEDLDGTTCFIEKQYVLAFDSRNPKVWKVVLKLQMVQACLYTLFDAAFGVYTVLINSGDYKQKLGISGKN